MMRPGLKFSACALAVALVAGFQCSTGGKGDVSGTITISGAWALYPMAVAWAEQFQKLHPGIRIDIAAGGAGKGMADALAEIVDLGMVSRDIYPAEIEKGAWWVSVVKDAVVPMVNESNPVVDDLLRRGMTRQMFAALWVEGRATTWGGLVGGANAQPVNIYTRSDACGAAETWAKYLGAKQEDLSGVGVYGDPGLAEAVAQDPLGIGFNNVNYAYDSKTGLPVKGLRPIPIDLDGNGVLDDSENFHATRADMIAAIGEGRYPSPPARTLHFVAHGTPANPAVAAFLKWALVDGQKYVADAGYVVLPESLLKEQLAKLGGR